MKNIINSFPSFMWLVRDFSLRLVDEKGKKIQAKEYLNKALELKEGTSELAIRKNNVRSELVNFFKGRDCFPLIRPVDDESKLQKMAQLKDH